MVDWIKENLSPDDPQLKPSEVDEIVAAPSAQSERRAHEAGDKQDSSAVRNGVALIQMTCTDCHRFGSEGSLGDAPDLNGYGSYEWMLGLLSDPTHERFYRDSNDRMPSFAEDLAHPEKHKVNVRELSLIVDWIRGDYYDPKDERPVLPHTEEFARRTVEFSRLLELPPRAVVGAAKE
jgi:mono/diheme cytochrome c family protein